MVYVTLLPPVPPTYGALSVFAGVDAHLGGVAQTEHFGGDDGEGRVGASQVDRARSSPAASHRH